MKKLIVMLFVAMQALALRANVIEQADSAYMADDFAAAVNLYTRAIDELGPSAERYYNLGNAYYRADKPGMAIVNYERALRLDPTNRDIIDNLEFVNSRTVDRIEQSTSLVGGAADRIASKVHPDVWAWVALACFVLAIAGVCVYFFAGGVAIRKIGFFGSGLLIVVCVLANILSYRAAARINADNRAIVTSPSVILSTTPRAPKDRSEEAMLLHEGTGLTIIDSLAAGGSTWYDVKVDDSHRAWIPAEAIEII